MSDLVRECPGGLWGLFLGNVRERGEGVMGVQLVSSRMLVAMPQFPVIIGNLVVKYIASDSHPLCFSTGKTQVLQVPVHSHTLTASIFQNLHSKFQKPQSDKDRLLPRDDVGEKRSCEFTQVRFCFAVLHTKTCWKQGIVLHIV